MKKLSIGSWAYCFGPYKDKPVDFHTVVRKLGELSYDGVELGGFPPHPSPDSCATPEQRRALRQEVADHGLAFSGLAANLWMHKLLSVADARPYLDEFTKNLQFAEDLGIDCIRVDSLEPPDVFEKTGIDPRLGRDRAMTAWSECAHRAADRGIRVAWEFEPGFAFNKPSEILAIADEMTANHTNFGVMYDTCHAHMCAAVGARQPGPKETLPGGALELLQKLRGKVAHVHLIDSDGTLHDNETSTHAPFGQGVIDFDPIISELVHHTNVPSDWWCIDLCFWPDAWNVTEQSKVFLDAMRRKYRVYASKWRI